MTVFLSYGQLAVVCHASDYFDAKLDNPDLQPMFRETGPDMEVGLAYSERGQHFIVRELVNANATLGMVEMVCARLIARLAISYSKVMRQRTRWCK